MSKWLTQDYMDDRLALAQIHNIYGALGVLTVAEIKAEIVEFDNAWETAPNDSQKFVARTDV